MAINRYPSFILLGLLTVLIIGLSVRYFITDMDLAFFLLILICALTPLILIVIIIIDSYFHKKNSKIIERKFSNQVFFPISGLFFNVDWKSRSYSNNKVPFNHVWLPWQLRQIVRNDEAYEIEKWELDGNIEGELYGLIFRKIVSYRLISYDFQDIKQRNLKFSTIIIQYKNYSSLFLSTPREIELQKLIKTRINFPIQVISRLPLVSSKILRYIEDSPASKYAINPFCLLSAGLFNEDEFQVTIHQLQAIFLQTKIKSTDPKGKLFCRLEEDGCKMSNISERTFFNAIFNTLLESIFTPNIYFLLKPLDIDLKQFPEEPEEMLHYTDALISLYPLLNQDEPEDPRKNIFEKNSWHPRESVYIFTQYLRKYEYLSEKLSNDDFIKFQNVLELLKKVCDDFIEVYTGFLKELNCYKFKNYASILEDFKYLRSLTFNILMKISIGNLKPTIEEKKKSRKIREDTGKIVPRIFLAGTDDIRDVANYVNQELPRLGFEPIWFHKKFDIGSEDAMKTCLENVKKSDKFILILDKRYGLPYKDTGHSITEEEFLTAYYLKKPILIFVRKDTTVQSSTFHALLKEGKDPTEQDLKGLNLKADKGLFQFLERLMHLKEKEGGRIPWIESYDFADDIIKCVEQKWDTEPP